MKKIILGASVSLCSLILIFWMLSELMTSGERFLVLLLIVLGFAFASGIILAVEGTPAEDWLARMFDREEDGDE